MSNHLISAVYKRQLGSHMRKSVMALLADKASDDGSGIWASKQTLADELCCSKQTVISTISRFIEDGLLVESGTRKCRTGATVEYRICVEVLEALPLVPCHAAKESRRLTGQAAEPVNGVDARGQAAGPKPSLNPPLPKKDKPSSDNRARKFILPPHIPAEPWRDFEDMRRRIGKAMTDRARELAVKRLDKLAEDGWPPGDVLNHSTLNSYQGLFPPPKESRNERSLAGHQPADGLSATRRAALRVFGPPSAGHA